MMMEWILWAFSSIRIQSEIILTCLSCNQSQIFHQNIIWMEVEEPKEERDHQQANERIEEVEDGPLPDVFKALEGKVGNDHETIYRKVGRIFFKDYDQEEKDKIQELLQAWKEFDLDILLENDEYSGVEFYRYYREVDILAARVYIKVLCYFKQKRGQRDDSADDQEWEALRQLLWKDELDYALDRFFWRKRVIKNSGISYDKEGAKRDVLKDMPYSEEAVMVSHWIEQSKIVLLKKIQDFMKAIGLIVLEGQVENSLLLKLQRIGKKQQKQLFLETIAFQEYEDAKVLQTQLFKTHGQQYLVEEALRKRLPNYFFYKQPAHGPRTIHSLHSKFQNYHFLESRHDYIQWMFPNHYGSAFNSKSFQLTYLEGLLFLDDQQVGLRMLHSTYLFLDFMGIRLKMPSLALAICSWERLREALLVNYHNHLRVMRVLACLSVTGFRPIALEIVELLDTLSRPKGFLEKQRREFENSWGIYGQEAPGVPKERAKLMCFLEHYDFPGQHKILASIRQIMHKDTPNPPEKQHKEASMQVQVRMQNAKEQKYLKEVPSAKEQPTDNRIQQF